MGLLSSNTLNKSGYQEVARVELPASEVATLQSATIVDREDSYGPWRTIDFTTKDGAVLSGVMSTKCNHPSGVVDLNVSKVFLVTIKKTGDSGEGLNRWHVE